MSEWMRQAVDEVHSRWLPLPVEWNEQQRQTYLGLETERLDKAAFDLAATLQAGAIRHWSQQNGGAHPDHETTVRLHRTSEQNAREAIVREQLYDKIPPQVRESPDPPAPVSGVPWEKRWMHARFRPEPSEPIMELTGRVWPERSSMFRAVAAYLLATRHQEGRRLPSSPQDALAADLVGPINEKLGRIGYPPE